MAWKYNPLTLKLERVTTATVDYANETVGASLKVEIEKIANEDLVIGDPVKMDDDNSCSKPNVNSEANASVVGLCTSTALTGSIVKIQISGVFTNSIYNSLPFNSPVFQTSGGGLGINPTSIVGEFWCRVGKSYGNGSVLIRPEEPVEVLSWVLK